MRLTECPEGVMRNGCEIDKIEGVMSYFFGQF